MSEIIIADDGKGSPNAILSTIVAPYWHVYMTTDKSKRGLGLEMFIGKTLLEKNSAQLICRNSQTRGGAEVKIIWKNSDLRML